MSSDLNIFTDEGRLNIRAGAIIQKRDRLLFVWAPEGNHWYTIGGRIRFGESSYEAVQREIAEELGDAARFLSGGRLVVIEENFYRINDTSVHEYGYYYLFDGAALPDELTMHDGSGHLKWLSYEEIARERLYPLFLKRYKQFPQENILHFIVNETD